MEGLWAENTKSRLSETWTAETRLGVTLVRAEGGSHPQDFCVWFHSAHHSILWPESGCSIILKLILLSFKYKYCPEWKQQILISTLYWAEVMKYLCTMQHRALNNCTTCHALHFVGCSDEKYFFLTIYQKYAWSWTLKSSEPLTADYHHSMAGKYRTWSWLLSFIIELNLLEYNWENI